MLAYLGKIVRKVLGWMRPTRRIAIANPSGLAPAGHAVLLAPYEPDFALSPIVIPDTVRANTVMVEMRAIVIELGDQAWRNDDHSWLKRLMVRWRPRALPGDKVMVHKYSGAVVQGPLDGRAYRMVNDQDIFCCIIAERSVAEQAPSSALGRAA